MFVELGSPGAPGCRDDSIVGEQYRLDHAAKLVGLLQRCTWQGHGGDCQAAFVELRKKGSPGTGEELCLKLEALWDSPAGGFLMYTSGTTGQPKGVKRASPGTVGQALSSWASLGRSIGLGGEGTHLVCGPVYHAAPGLYGFYEFLGRRSLVIQKGFEAEAFCAAVEEHGAWLAEEVLAPDGIAWSAEAGDGWGSWELPHGGILRIFLEKAAPVG